MTDPKIAKLQELMRFLMPTIESDFKQAFDCELISPPKPQSYELVDGVYHLDDVQGVCRVEGIRDHQCLFDLTVQQVPGELMRVTLDTLRITEAP